MDQIIYVKSFKMKTTIHKGKKKKKNCMHVKPTFEIRWALKQIKFVKERKK